MSAQPAGRPALTWRERAALDAIGSYLAVHGYPPSTQDLGAAVGLASRSSVSRILDRLQIKGYLVRELDRPRTIRIVR